jgi:ferredoxin-type protein NapH
MKLLKFLPMTGSFIFFLLIAVIFSIIFKTSFYFLNFLIIGICCSLGLGLWPVLPNNKKDNARILSMILVGSYMVFGLGFGLIYIVFGHISSDNMQIEGFWFWLLSGIYAAGVMHYSIAKITGPFLYGRAWCGWCCWTGAVLDLLPYKKPFPRINKKFEIIRYLHFILSAGLVFILVFIFNIKHDQISGVYDFSNHISNEYKMIHPILFRNNYFAIPEVWWFAIGNLFYYLTGILLAFILKDNRAFCKYLCPIVIFLKIGSRFSLAKIKTNRDKCIDCKLCEKNCPMNINITGYLSKNKRILSTECILCMKCVSSCSKKALSLSIGFDAGFKEDIIRKKDQY